ncbi:hypothetical protein DPSP01_004621 [Paraphaeosphaeria sporulosa]|uniref:BTB domain-containing protein n=1 Tax=Paraphaeosphaeria sporulosa TaxID=1460663 RepID=A0A177C9L8_9PLEO|nr:uncharacterized protein CC84DRAFT_1166197 [Paraphaeosphaeria sporulosa]OAG04076.1 hypothetical protein CC84DRAFT_1166197 [Paraphaeosphaeria sporulosa]
MAEEDALVVIAPAGDLILDVRQAEGTPRFSYRVHSKVLRDSSRYFENLLSDRFREGEQLATALEALKVAGLSDLADAPVDALPRVAILDVGRTSALSVRNLVADFLRAIHGEDLSAATPPVPNLANIAVVADRFDATDTLSRYVRKRKYGALLDAKSGKGKISIGMTEERVRQKLLVGLLFDHAPWVTRYSKHLILRDSSQWQPGVEEDHTKPLWWDLPNGVEDELIQRREYILETINSLQSHFLKLYTSGERQCKLGYDTSVQCDSFQLGEMIRFFIRLGTVRLQGTIYDNTEPTYHTGDIERLLESLRQCSSYQVDRNHAHCGLRTRLLPLVDLLQNQLCLDTTSLDVGLCLECWNNHRDNYAWSVAKRPVLWAQHPSVTGNRMLSKGHRRTPSSCLHRHIVVRDLFMATDRNWTARDAVY